jgi:hypothetical protein
VCTWNVLPSRSETPKIFLMMNGIGSTLACPRAFQAATPCRETSPARCPSPSQNPSVIRGSSVSSRLCLSVSAILSPPPPDRYLDVEVSSTFCTRLTVIVKPFLFFLSLSAAAHVRGSKEGEGGVAAGTAQERSWLRSPPGSYPGSN